MNRVLKIAVVCFTLVSIMYAQTVKDQTLLRQKDSSDKPQQPERPKFSPELARLSFLAGTFDVSITQYRNPMAQGGPGKGRNSTRWALDSLALITDHEDHNPDGEYKGHGVFMYDTGAKQYKCYWFNNWGGATEYKGNFVGDTLALEAETQSANGPMTMKLRWYPDGVRVRFNIITDMGSGEKLMMESTSTPVRPGPTGIRKR